MKRHQRILLLIIVISLLSLVIDLPRISLNFSLGSLKVDTAVGGYQLSLFGGRFFRDLEVKRGLDLSGGVHVVLRARMDEVAAAERDTALEAVRNVIERRIDFFGVTEPVVQTSKVGSDYRIIVEMPGVTETASAIELIGQTAQLDFQELVEEIEPDPDNPDVSATFRKTNLTGRDLKKAAVTFEQQSGQPQVAIEFTEEGAQKFEEITGRNVNKPLAIFLDEAILSAPMVQEAISGGRAVITGQFDLEEAKKLAIQLNAGALPVPIEVLEQRNIGPTLGQSSLEKSVTAGLIGLALVGLFMWGYYGKLGFLADVGLVIYGLVTLAIYKLIPVTLTLAGIAGFLLSIGMAVDSNILIFERIKEELRAGRPHDAALELGFGRAWDSIRDANVCTLIICFVLFNPFNWGFLSTSGMVRGFALTLTLGIGVSLFTGVMVTRTLVRMFYRKGT